MAQNKNRERYRKNRQRYRMMRILKIVGVVVAVLVLILAVLHFRSKKQEAASEPEQPSSEAASSEVVDSSVTSEPEEVPLTPEQQFYEQLKNNPNATRTAPEVKDPATWEANAKEILEGLAASQNYDLTVKEGYPYLIAVNRSASTATVYTANAEGKYMVPYMAMVVSCGKDSKHATPTGQFNTYNDSNIPNDGPKGDGWKKLNDEKYGTVYGQYATRITGSILFHSVPYLSANKADLEYEEFNNLGAPASAGCVRMAVVDVKWIRDNCPLGTPVIIYDDAENPGPMGKPGTINMEIDNEELRGWDPTDPDEKNPWPEQYRTGTAILSEAAAAAANEQPVTQPAASEASSSSTTPVASDSTKESASSSKAVSTKESASSSKAVSTKESASSSKAVSTKESTSSSKAASVKEEAASSKETAEVASKESVHETVTETPKQEEKASTTVVEHPAAQTEAETQA